MIESNDLFELSKKPENHYKRQTLIKVLRFAFKKKIPKFFVLASTSHAITSQNEQVKFKKKKNRFHVNNNHEISFRKKKFSNNLFCEIMSSTQINKNINITFKYFFNIVQTILNILIISINTHYVIFLQILFLPLNFFARSKKLIK